MGNDADLCVVDVDATWTVAPAALRDRHRGSPVTGRTLRGRVVRTLVNSHRDDSTERASSASGADQQKLRARAVVPRLRARVVRALRVVAELDRHRHETSPARSASLSRLPRRCSGSAAFSAPAGTFLSLSFLSCLRSARGLRGRLLLPRSARPSPPRVVPLARGSPLPASLPLDASSAFGADQQKRQRIGRCSRPPRDSGSVGARAADRIRRT